MESTRAQEAAIRKQTNEELEAFRRQREQAEKAARAEEGKSEDIPQDVQWHTGPRKKRKVVEKEAVKGVKVRRVSSSTGEKQVGSPRTTETKTMPKEEAAVSSAGSTKAAVAPPAVSASPAAGLGLGAYSSDED